MSIYDSAPEEPDLAFEYYVQIYIDELNEEISEDTPHYYDHCIKFITKVTSTASALDLNILTDWGFIPNDDDFEYMFSKFRNEVEYYAQAIRVKNGRRVSAYSVRLTQDEKHSIHDNISKIRQVIESSNLSGDKRDLIFKLLAALTLEIDRDRTRFDRLADSARRLAGLSAEVEKDGARPWLKYIWAIFGVVDKAKEDEIERLPRPTEQKRLPPPPGKRKSSSSEDEIPF